MPPLSRLEHYPMKNSLFAGERTALVAPTQGRVLEICCEAGKNIPYYSPWVTDLAIVCLDGAPAPVHHETTDRGLRVEVMRAGSNAVALPFDDASFDWAVSTLTLCRLKDAPAILAEVRRVLKPSGAFLFLEHGRSENPATRRWQRRLHNLWMRIGGCELDREIDRMIDAAGMRIESLKHYQLGQPRFLSAMYRGSARPA
jgi:ubiquinone/menaquinone biosynthesis C-methylase UbiE